MSLAKESGLVLSSWVVKHPDALAEALIVNREGKTAWGKWQTEDWQGYQRHLPEVIDHAISKVLTQWLERTNGMVRQHTGRWHRRQNKFGKVWEQTLVTVRLVISDFNWIWRHSQ